MSVKSKQIPEPFRTQIEDFKNFIVQKSHEEVIEDYHLEPMAHILFIPPDVAPDEKPGMAIVPIPGELLNSGEGKDLLTQIIMPKVLDSLIDQGNKPFCISFLTEGWQWELEGLTKEDIERIGWEEIRRTREKIEVVMITFETEYGCQVNLFEKRGTKKNSAGEYVEGVWLKEREKTEEGEHIGRFTDLLKNRSSIFNAVQN